MVEEVSQPQAAPVRPLQVEALALLETDRYNVGALSVLSRAVQSQVVDGWYDLDINMAILKLYQFHPNEDVVELDVLIKIMALALMQLPKPDFKLCRYLIPSQHQNVQNVQLLAEMAEKLEACRYGAFWQLLVKEPQVLAVVPGLEDSLRRSVFATVCLTYQEIPSKVLAEFLNFPMANISHEFNVELVGDNFILPKSEENQLKQKTASSGPTEVQLPQLAQVLSNALF